jgi:hypothetical protein
MRIETQRRSLILNVAMKLLGCAALLSVMTASLAEDPKPIELDFGRASRAELYARVK